VCKSDFIHYIKGDATEPVTNGRNAIIAHVCNDEGKWGHGFVMALHAKWPHIKDAYKEWYDHPQGGMVVGRFVLGNVQYVVAERGITVANMIGQRGIESQFGIAPIRYPDLRIALEKVAQKARHLDADVHMPMIGSGLAGGDWLQIQGIIEVALARNGVDTYIYELPEGSRSPGQVNRVVMLQRNEPDATGTNGMLLALTG
jgi:O-acetyl-ADP-ribose deacetylase (regulator of RNase III)